MKVNILGTEYTIVEQSTSENPKLTDCDGYCDKTSKTICVITKGDSDLEDFAVYQKKVKRHEIIHAFLFESGLHENWKHDEWGHDESYVDWIAVQFPKLLEVFKAADSL